MSKATTVQMLGIPKNDIKSKTCDVIQNKQCDNGTHCIKSKTGDVSGLVVVSNSFNLLAIEENEIEDGEIPGDLLEIGKEMILHGVSPNRPPTQEIIDKPTWNFHMDDVPKLRIVNINPTNTTSYSLYPRPKKNRK